MKKIYLFLLCVCGLNAKIIDGIAFKVNDQPITLYEISQLKKEKKLSDKEAREQLILKVIKAQEMERLEIIVDDLRIDQQIAAAANMQGISRDEFVARMVGNGYSYEELRAFYKDYLAQELLTQRILSTHLKIVDENELKKYYEGNQKKFTLPKEVVIVQYVSQNEKALTRAMNNPLTQVPGVDKREEKVALQGINPQIAQMFAQTPKGSFTQVIQNGGAFLAFYIKDKRGSELMPYDQIKPMIMQEVVYARKEAILKEYFDRLVASAIIVEMRK